MHCAPHLSIRLCARSLNCSITGAVHQPGHTHPVKNLCLVRVLAIRIHINRHGFVSSCERLEDGNRPLKEDACVSKVLHPLPSARRVSSLWQTVLSSKTFSQYASYYRQTSPSSHHGGVERGQLAPVPLYSASNGPHCSAYMCARTSKTYTSSLGARAQKLPPRN